MSTTTLGEIAEFVNGAAFKPGDWHDAGLPIIRIQNLTDPSKPFHRTQREVSEKLHVLPGDLLVSWSATLGVFEWPADAEEAVLNQHIFRVLPRRDRVDKRYLMYALDRAISDMTRHLHGATMKHVNRREFVGTEVPLPPIDEQRRIAAVLDEADELRAKRRASLALIDSLNESIFIEMFGDPIANRHGWPRVSLAELLERIDSGKSPVCMSRPAGLHEWGVLKLGAVTWGVYDAGENKALPAEVPPDPRHEVKQGDLLFARKNTRELVGACALVHDTRPRLLLSDLVFRLVVRDDALIHPIYLHRLLSLPAKRREVQRLAGGSAGSMPNISKSNLLGVKVELPPLDLQQEFARRVTTILGMRRTAAESSSRLDEFLASLEQRAFAGQL